MIYLYWEGDIRHWYYELCLETIRIHNPSVVVSASGGAGK